MKHWWLRSKREQKAIRRWARAPMKDRNTESLRKAVEQARSPNWPT